MKSGALLPEHLTQCQLATIVIKWGNMHVPTELIRVKGNLAEILLVHCRSPSGILGPAWNKNKSNETVAFSLQ